mmetsp:Transcript_11044/g.20423  ORF Transcript_11044/g.20423 Transcript_11044/m.20423 type:complete len:458 (+) Transcript_11044:84-1457(+)|eukprot:CAMPEP_0184522978 /NCGR_PEP_ID=MMETSP0198_2-20121128/8609_1 /TAXON_ID=1112570 /ORGANISM="Thraustochytrium sp., Strain LLF1b" /LENGTH=457 /DNA_ID=CAMNT_0026913919 /DNA_START=421 /DNA_END=1794 /DNA_ORIENTATION=-
MRNNTLVKSLRRRLSTNKNDDPDVQALQQVEDLPSLKSVASVPQRAELLKRKLEFCSELANFTSTEANHKQFVTNKRKALLDLVDFLNSGPARSKQDYLTEPVLIDLIDMVKCNLFVPLPPQCDDYDPEEDEPWLDVSWPHKQVVYELLLRLVVSSDFPAKVGKKQGMVDQDFCVGLINLFESDDPRERDYLKTILHRIYGKFMTHRGYIRKQIGFVFARFSVEGKRQNGIAELLEILGSIINGFALPLKPEHLSFIKNSLIPLHKSPWVQSFTSQLTYCITQYIEKDPTIAQLILEKMVDYWPHGNTSKQVMFLIELEEVLELVPPPILELVADKFFKCIARCICSDHFQVCERTLFLWNNEHIVNLFALEKTDIFIEHNFKQIYAALSKNVDSAHPHWNSAVTMLSYNVIDIYKERYGLDPEMFNKPPQPMKDEKLAASRLKQWEEFERQFNTAT